MLSVIRLTVRLARAVRFPAGANVAQAFGHDAAGMGEISMPNMVLLSVGFTSHHISGLYSDGGAA
jgi:hypothetical protein